jgi:hypothetical protein
MKTMKNLVLAVIVFRICCSYFFLQQNILAQHTPKLNETVQD